MPANYKAVGSNAAKLSCPDGGKHILNHFCRQDFELTKNLLRSDFVA